MAATKPTVKRAPTPPGAAFGVLYVVDYAGRQWYFDKKSDAVAEMKRLWKEEKSLRESGLRPYGPKRKRRNPKRKRTSVKRNCNPTVYDSAGKSMGKFKRKAAKVVARVVGGTVGKPKARNPETLLFKTKAAVKKYAKARGLKVKSIRKLKKAK